MTTPRKTNELEKTWTAHGLDCAVVKVFGPYDTSGFHRCGYVRLPAEHPWHGVDYSDEVDIRPPRPNVDEMDAADAMDDFGTINVLALMLGGGEDIGKRPDSIIRVHGGVTYASDAYYLDDAEGTWAFGFDCAHLDDTADRWTLEAVVTETERMAEQLAAIADLAPADSNA